MKITEQHIAIEQGLIFVKIWTPAIIASETPIVLLHDSLGSVEQWRHFPEKLANCLSRQVIAYDRLGFGKSEARTSVPSIAFIEEEAELYFPQIRQALGIEHFLLLGHSVGGAMAVNIAAKEKACIGVITIAAQAFVEALTIEGIEKAKLLFQRSEMLAKIAKWHGEKAQWVVNAWTEVWLNPKFRHWKLERVKRINCPILAIHGAHDEYGSVAFPRYIVQNAPGKAQLEILEECGHMPHVSHVEQTLTAIERFAEELV